MIPKTIKGWFVLLAWFGLLLFMLMNCSIHLDYGHTPMGANGEKKQLYFYFKFQSNDKVYDYTVTTRV